MKMMNIWRILKRRFFRLGRLEAAHFLFFYGGCGKIQLLNSSKLEERMCDITL